MMSILSQEDNSCSCSNQQARVRKIYSEQMQSASNSLNDFLFIFLN